MFYFRQLLGPSFYGLIIIKVNAENIYLEELSKNRSNFVGNLFGSSGNIKPWVKFKDKLCLLESRKFQWML